MSIPLDQQHLPLDQQHLPPEDDDGMTLMDHLLELRQRLVYAGIAIILGMGVGVFLVLGPPEIVTTIVTTVTGNDGSVTAPTQGLTSTEVFTSYMMVALTVGVILAMPVIVYQLIAFIAPGLLPEEKRYLFTAIPFVTLFFLFGVAFGWYITVPTAMQFLLGFGNNHITEIKPSLSSLIKMVTTLLLMNGLVFELPIIIYVLAAMGLVTAQKLSDFRRYAMVIIIIIAAIITPTGDPINLMLMALPMYLLYEFGILLARLAPKRKDPELNAS